MQPQNPYDFMHAGQISRNGGSKKTRILIVAGGATVLLIVALIFISILGSAGKADKQSLITLAQQQTELIRVSKLGQERAKDSSAKNLAVTVGVSLQSDQTALQGILKSQHIKLSAKELAAGKKQETDSLLNNAEQTNKFDAVFIQTIQLQLKNYQKTLNDTYTKTQSKKTKALLEHQYKNARLLANSK